MFSQVLSREIRGKLIQGDCLKVMSSIPDNSIDLAVIDPPYGIDYKEWDKFDDFLNFSESWIKECFRALKSTGSFYSFMGWSNIAEFKLLLDKYGIIRNWITWWRHKGRSSSTNFKSMKEEILYYTKTNSFTWNEIKMLKKHVIPYTKDGKPRGWFTNEEGIKCRWTGLGNVWCYTAPFWNMPEKVNHPSQKPELMIERIILTSSNENEVILDPFMGSGTTAIAAQNLNRRWIGIELDKEYFNLANERIERNREEIARRLF